MNIWVSHLAAVTWRRSVEISTCLFIKYHSLDITYFYFTLVFRTGEQVRMFSPTRKISQKCNWISSCICFILAQGSQLQLLRSTPMKNHLWRSLPFAWRSKHVSGSCPEYVIKHHIAHITEPTPSYRTTLPSSTWTSRPWISSKFHGDIMIWMIGLDWIVLA